MGSKTYSDLRSFVQKKLDLQEELFITPAEMLDSTEEAIRECEAEIHKFHAEDRYFLAQAAIPLVSGQSDYALPENIYANKILRMIYRQDSTVYTIRKSRFRNTFESTEFLDQQQDASAATWEYRVYNNDHRVGPRIRIYPTPQESALILNTTGVITAASPVITSMASTVGLRKGFFVQGVGMPYGTRVQSVDSATQVTLTASSAVSASASPLVFTEGRLLLWYIREAYIPTSVNDMIDIPEFWNFIAQYVVVECLKKELGNPRLPEEKSKLEFVRQQMTDTLTEMIPDQDDEIEKDFDFYMDGDLSYV